jgi:hypothetical protein
MHPVFMRARIFIQFQQNRDALKLEGSSKERQFPYAIIFPTQGGRRYEH